MSINPQVGVPPTTSAVTKCVQQILEALTGAKTIGSTDKKNIYFMLGAQLLPFDGAGMDTAQIFKPQESDFKGENKDFFNPILDQISQLSQSITNPLSGILNQGSIFNSTLTSLLGSGSNNILTSVFDKVQAALRAFFLLGEQSDSNLAGLLLYAVQETTPTMINTVGYVRKMEALVKQIMEGCSKLPPAFLPEIPNLVVVRNLCSADARLNKVIAELAQYQTLDLATLASASADVCGSRDIVKSGIVPQDSLALLQSVFQLTDLQINQVATTRFTPDPSFRLKLDQLATLDDFIQENDADIYALNTNLTGLLDTLANTESLGISSLMQLMLGAIQQQIQNVRARLETEAINFIRDNGFSVPDRVVAENNSGTSIYDPSQIGSFLDQTNSTLKVLSSYSNSINNAETFAELSALCIALSRVNGMYTNLLKIMKQQTPILAAVKKFVKQHIHAACQPKDASGIHAAVTSFIAAVNTRLSGQNGAGNAVTTQGLALLQLLKDYKGYVNCVHGSATGGSIDITNILNNIPGNPGHAPVSVGNIADLLRFMPQLKSALKTLDLKRITGVEAKEYDALTKLMDGLSCLAAACQNSYVKLICGMFQVIFKKELDKRTAISTTQASLGQEVPAIAMKANVDYRYKDIQRRLTELQKFVSAGIETVCAPVTNMSDATLVDASIPASSIVAVSDTRTKQAANEAAAQASALKQLTVLGTSAV